MLKRSVIAADITNLTDARYFAARGVDYMLYDLKNIGINDIMAIAEWVEGVKTLIKMDEENIHLIDEVLLRLSPFGVGSSNTECLRKILQYNPEGKAFHLFPADEKENAKIILTLAEHIDPDNFHISPNNEVHAFSEVEASEKGLNDFLLKSDAGVIIKGSSEIETGLKSFDNMDLLLELLEED